MTRSGDAPHKFNTMLSEDRAYLACGGHSRGGPGQKPLCGDPDSKFQLNTKRNTTLDTQRADVLPERARKTSDGENHQGLSGGSLHLE